MYISEKYINKIINETINKLVEDFGLNVKGNVTINDIKNGVPLYHRPSDGEDVMKSLFKYGFSREFTGSNGGNMYGPGVYTVYKLQSSQTHATGYGHNIIKAYLLGGYQDFLIFNSDIAKQVYGKDWHIVNQIKKIMPADIANDLLKHVRLEMDGRSSISAHNVWLYLRNRLDSTKVRGFVFTGGHDGDVCFIRDFSSVIPYSYSRDNGATWNVGITDELIKRAGQSVDTEFKYRNSIDDSGTKNFDDVSDRAINGFVMVHKKNKINFINIETDELISDKWFDFATNFDSDGYAEVSFNGEEMSLYNDNGIIYVTDEDGFPLYELN